MQLDCPRCGHVLEYSQVAPRFCSNCGLSLSGESPASAPTLPGTVPINSQPTQVFLGQPSRPGLASHPEVVDGYRLLRPLGGGGMGTVFEAEELETGRHVAVKLIRPEFADSLDTVERFRREGRLASTVHHPRCVFVLAADEEAGRPYIVMELMPGQTLADRVEARGPLPVREAVAHILDIIDGLQEAHRQGLIHRDVKPSNCFLDADERVKVGDFGLAKSLLGPEHLTRSGSFLGTVLFASPEQIRNEPLNHQTDVYSVCATLFYLLTGRAPFQDDDPAAALARAVTDPPPSLRQFRKDVPRTLDEVVLRGLARSRRQRWQSLEELRLALMPFLEGPHTLPDPGWRISAYLVDLLLLIPFELALEHLLLYFAPTSGYQIEPLLRSLATNLLAGLIYFAVPEWLAGCTPGKFLLRLRVRDAATGDRPSLGRSALRTFWFYLFKDSTQFLTGLAILALAPRLYEESDVGVAVRAAATIILLALLPFLSGGLGLALLASTMRRRNGYRGIHELLSGTRVIRLPAQRPRFRLPATAAWPSPGALPDEVPREVGAFTVRGVARVASDEMVLQGADPVLDRPVWLWLRRGSETLTPSRRQLAREGRPRWLAGGVQEGWTWDAFVAAPGCLLADLVTRRRLGWTDALTLLDQLAAELEQAQEEGTLPARLSAEQVWVQASGRVLLLDAPPRQPAVVATPLDLLRQVAALTLERRARPAGELTSPIRAPVPGHAMELLDRLLGGPEPFTRLSEVRAAVAEAHQKPEEIDRPVRALQMALTAAGLSPGLALLFAIGPVLMLVACVICILGAATAELALEQVAEHRAGVEGVGRQEEARAGLQATRARLAWDREVVLASWSWFIRERLQELEVHLGEQYRERLRVEPEGEVDEEGLDVYLARSDDLTAGPAEAAQELLQQGWLVWVYAAWPGLLALWAGLTRGGLTLRLAGVALVDGDGRPAAPWRCAWRALLVWVPVVMLLYFSAWLDLWRVSAARAPWSGEEVRLVAWTSWHLWWGAVVLLCVYVFIAVTWPNRGPHDRLSGVYPVPR